MKPIITTSKKAVQHSNLNSIRSVGRESTIPVVRFIQKIQPTSQSGTPLSRLFVNRTYTLPTSQTACMNTVLYLCYGLPYQCGHNKWLRYGVGKHTWMVLRKVCFCQQTPFQLFFNPVINCSVHIPTNPPEISIFELVDTKHARTILVLPTGFL